MNTTQPTISFSFSEKSIVQASSRVAAIIANMFKWSEPLSKEEQTLNEDTVDAAYTIETRYVAFKALKDYTMDISSNTISCTLHGDCNGVVLENISIPKSSLFNKDVLCCIHRAATLCPMFKIELVERLHHKKILKGIDKQNVVDRAEFIITVSMEAVERKRFNQHATDATNFFLVNTGSVLSIGHPDQPKSLPLTKYHLNNFTRTLAMSDFLKEADFSKDGVFYANGSIHVDIDKLYEKIIAKKRKAEHIDPMYLVQHELSTSTNVCIVGRKFLSHTSDVLLDLANALPNIRTTDQYLQTKLNAIESLSKAFMGKTFGSLDGRNANPELPNILGVSFVGDKCINNPQSFEILSKEIEPNNLAGTIELKQIPQTIMLTTGEQVEHNYLLFKIKLNELFNQAFLDSYEALKKSGVAYIVFSDVYLVNVGHRKMLLDSDSNISLSVAQQRVSMIRTVLGTSDVNFNKLPFRV